MKCITLLLDGASDRTYEELNHQTPLKFAKTPHLDKISIKSQCGLMTPISEGIQLGTDLAHFLMFSYPIKAYPNRSIIDAIGEGLSPEDGRLYLRASFAQVKEDNGFQLLDRFVPDLSDEDIASFLNDLSMTIDGYSFECIHSYDSHGFLVVSGENLSADLSDSDPFSLNYVMAVEAFETEAVHVKRLADAVNTYIKKSYKILSEHPVNHKRKDKVNMVMTKWAGLYNKVASFYEVTGKKGVLIGKSKLLMGLASYIGMDYHPYDDFESAIQYALNCDYDYVHLHTKGPDEASHKKDALKKVGVLELIDRQIKPLVTFNGLLVVTSDHSTPCDGETIHSGESVAFMARGHYIRQDDVKTFDEVACSKGSVHLYAKDFMNYIINASDRGILYHLRQGQVKRNYKLDQVKRLL